MLPKNERIAKQFFPKVLQGKNFSHEVLRITKTQPYSEKKPFQCAVIVSKKIAKTAVARNLLRRRTYTVIKNNKTCFNKGMFVVTLKKPNLTTREITEAIQSLCHNLNK